MQPQKSGALEGSAARRTPEASLVPVVTREQRSSAASEGCAAYDS
jgi:hypothetical protein